jgi:hypothetical protein
MPDEIKGKSPTRSPAATTACDIDELVATIRHNSTPGG